MGSCFSSVMLFCFMKSCTFLCRSSVGIITVVLPLSAFTNVMLCLCAFSLSLMAVCISELWLLLSCVLCTSIMSVSYTHLIVAQLPKWDFHISTKGMLMSLVCGFTRRVYFKEGYNWKPKSKIIFLQPNVGYFYKVRFV